MKKNISMNWTAWISLACLAFVLTAQSVNSPISKNYAFSDYSVYQYVAQIMSEGGMPYRDTFDHKGPVFYLLNLLGYKIHPEYGMWLLDFLLMLDTGVYAYKIANKVLNRKISFFIVSVVLSGIPAWGYWIGNTPESCVLFFLMLFMYLFVEYVECQRLTNSQILEVGFFSAVALLMKPTFLAMPAVLIVAVIICEIKKKNYQLLRKCVVLFLIPFCGLIACITVWLGINGALKACIDQYLMFNTQYSSVKKEILDYLYVVDVFLEKPSTLFGLFCIWINFMRWSEYAGKEKRLLLSTYFTWAVVFLVSIMPGRAYQQYTVVYYPMILVVAVLAFKGIDQMLKEDRLKKVVGMIIVILAAVNILLPNTKETVANIRRYTAEEGVKAQIVDFFTGKPGDYEISVVSPDDNWVYLQTGHHSATKYSYTQADLIHEIVKSDFIKEYSQAIDESSPRFIVERSRSNLFTNKVASNIHSRYEEVFRNDGYIVYELSGN